MHSYTDSLSDNTQHEVIFRNVRSRYEFGNKISVLYVLSPKTKTSTHDYIGIYPRGWNHLREFVGFEHPIPAPFEKPSLDRCIQFLCQPPHVSAALYRDYQFVYVNQCHEILGKSEFFQFVEDEEGIQSHCAAAYQEPNVCSEKESEWQGGNATSFENLRQYVSEAEYAYNSCYFGDNPGNSNQKVGVGGLDAASTACFAPQEASNSHFTQEESCYQNSEQESYYKPKRGRPLVKTRDGGYLEYQAISTEPLSSVRRSYDSYLSSKGIDTSQEAPYSKKWLPSQTWQYQSNHNPSTQLAPYPGRGDVNRGAIPKQCPKCHVPSDHIYKQQLMRHELDQAHEHIRDLNVKVDQLQQELQLSYAAQAKLKVVGEIAKTEARNAVNFLNSLMVSLVNQYKTKIVNFDNTVMYVTRELEAPGWLSRDGPIKTLLCGRPSNVRVVSGREKELKAIIGRQEMMIRKLHNDLKLASRIIECANLTNHNMKLEISKREGAKDIHSPQYTPCVDGGSPKRICDYNDANGSFDLTAIGKVVKNIGGGINGNSSDEGGLSIHISNSPETSKDVPEEKIFIVQPNYYQLDPMQFLNREVLVDDNGSSVCTFNDADGAITLNETNNNNYDSKNWNSHEKGMKPKCAVCEPTLGNVSDNVPTMGGSD